MDEKNQKSKSSWHCPFNIPKPLETELVCADADDDLGQTWVIVPACAAPGHVGSTAD